MEEAFQPRAPKRQRRQYQSCDNCRKGRRACNAVSLGINPLQQNTPATGAASIACSTCQRSKKECTFRWLQEIPRGTLPECLKQKFSTRYDPVMHGGGGEVPQGSQPPPQSRPANVSSSNETANRRTNAISQPVERQNNGPRQVRIAPHRDQLGMNNVEQQSTGLSRNDVGSAADVAADCTNWLENIGWSTSLLDDDRGQAFWQSGTAQVGERGLPFDDSGQSTTFASWDSPLYGSLLDYARSNAEGLDGGVDDSHRLLSYPFEQTDTVNQTQDTDDLALLTDSMLGSIPPCTPPVPDDVSFNMREFDLTQSFSKCLISDRLLAVYHDSFETSLSCWVTESNCPFKLPRLLLGSASQRTRLLSYLASTGFYQRIRRLDGAFSPLRKQPLSRGDCARASRALMLAILAFASQWTHSHDRRRRRVHSVYPETDATESRHAAGKNVPDTAGASPHDFERLIQQSLWNEAADAVHACFNVDSFELIFAQIIFSIMERASGHGRSEAHEHARVVSYHGDRSSFANVSASDPRDRVIASSHRRRVVAVGNERYLEIALRHLLAWKKRIASARRQQAALALLPLGHTASPHQPILAEDYQAFDMFFWFGVMCDTTAAVLNERVPVIPDTDAVFNLDDGPTASPPTGGDAPFGRHDHRPRSTAARATVWGSCVANAQPLFGAPTVRWPWAQGDAESVLQEAIPVKVLLWRRITVIKTLLARDETPPGAIERCVAETLRVYEHWQHHYGDFMRDCVSHHAQLPFKIQSWYVILSSHWHLAGLLVAHYIDLADGSVRSEAVPRSLRQSSALVWELQKANAYAIADLARVAKPPEAAGLSHHDRSFHYATAYGALVTEPWPEVLTQALTRACEVLLGWLSSTKDPTPRTSQQTWVSANTSASELTRHAASCIDALHLLGSSSDLAQLMASSLEDQLQALTEPPPPAPAFDVHWQDFGYDNLVY
ncbi:uncharacterized protein PV07_09369 [Cladophialophora immunda]|uniref:Uncharacterized protein n=1 Tax=Cladophialophora immunda TaxID=569365 RepID=A0A0D1ZER6_9EURO|nr:uncharacterized protein PV07_09369 [Cladophialophora immunda]KIW26256.1 hypothetical protein PV07_09369 [Cladophialophora immunda]